MATNQQREELHRPVWRIAEDLRNAVGVTREQTALVLGLGRPSIFNPIAHLRNNGHIERVGSNKTGWRRVIE